MVIDSFITEFMSHGAFFGMPSAYVYTILFLMEALLCIGSRNVFRKAGKTPWHALVPFLHHYDLYDIAWDGRVGAAAFVLRFIQCFGAVYRRRMRFSRPLLLLYIIVFLLHFGISAMMKLKLSRSFGRSLTFTFGLIFMNEICMFLLGYQDSEYLGRTLYRREVSSGKKTAVQIERDYLIQLYRTRSIIALIASVSVSWFTFRAIAGGLIMNPTTVTPERGHHLYRLFTVNSNTLEAIAATILIPYAIEGVRKRRFFFPRWALLLQYSGTICTTLTMVFALTLIWPILGSLAVTGMNFWLHLFCPILALVLLFSTQADNVRITAQESVLCLIPFYLYAVIYISNVILLGENNGGWRDIYRLVSYLPEAVSAPIMFMLGLSVATVLRVIYNKVADLRLQSIVRRWLPGADPVDVRISVFGLGQTAGLHSEESDINVPMDLFVNLSEQYDLSVHDLDAAYMTGVERGIRERKKVVHDRLEWLSSLAGIPEKEYLEKSRIISVDREAEQTEAL